MPISCTGSGCSRILLPAGSRSCATACRSRTPPTSGCSTMASAAWRRWFSAWLNEHDRSWSGCWSDSLGAESPSLDPESQRGPFASSPRSSSGSAISFGPSAADEVGDHLYARPRQRLRGGPRQLLIGHMDTVWPVGTLAEMPLHEEDGAALRPRRGRHEGRPGRDRVRAACTARARAAAVGDAGRVREHRRGDRQRRLDALHPCCSPTAPSGRSCSSPARARTGS